MAVYEWLIEMDLEASSSGGKNLPLPEAFVDFLNENGLDPSIYVSSDSIPRYVRYSIFNWSVMFDCSSS